MKLSKNDNGFGAIETLLIVIVLLVLGFAGWYVWHGGKDKATSNQKTSESLPASSTTDTSKSSSTSSSKLSVTEWSIQATYPDALGTVTYSFADHTSFALLSSTAEKLPQACGNNGDGYRGDSIARFNDNVSHGNPTTTKKIGDYTYYLYLASQAPSCTDTSLMQELSTDYTTLFNNLKAN